MRFKRGILPIFIALIVMGSFGLAGGGYAGIRYYQSDKYQKQADRLISFGQYDQALVMYEKSLNAWNRRETREKQSLAKMEKAAATSITEAQNSLAQMNFQECLDKLGNVPTDSQSYQEASAITANCQAKLDEETAKKTAEEEAAKKKAEEEAKKIASNQNSQTAAAASTPAAAKSTSTPANTGTNAAANPEPASQTSTTTNANSSASDTASTSTCQNNASPTFTHHITDTSKISSIAIPPRIVSGHLKTHSYLNTDHQRVPVYAPVDMKLYGGVHLSHGSDPDDYGIDFKASCEVMVRIGHITDPIQSIKDTFPTATTDSRTNYDITPIDFKAGDLIAYTTGTAAAGNWDFGVYNSSTKNRYADDPDWNNSDIYTTAVCPYDYFSSDLKSAYSSKYIGDFGDSTLDGAFFCQ